MEAMRRTRAAWFSLVLALSSAGPGCMLFFQEPTTGVVVVRVTRRFRLEGAFSAVQQATISRLRSRGYEVEVTGQSARTLRLELRAGANRAGPPAGGSLFDQLSMVGRQDPTVTFSLSANEAGQVVATSSLERGATIDQSNVVRDVLDELTRVAGVGQRVSLDGTPVPRPL
jgi:hypothetical protein